MHRGYIKLWRKTIDSGLIKNHKVWIFWTWCLLKANHSQSKKQVVGYQEVTLMPGQFIFGLKAASIETGLTIQECRTCIKFLKKCKNLTYKPTNKFSIISIINWDTYQQTEKTNNKQTNTHVTSSQQASNTQVTTNKNEKNEKNEKKTTLSEPEAPTSVCPHEKIRRLYNKILPELPTCTVRNKSFDQQTRARWNEDKTRQNLAWWENLFKDIRNSDFLMGRSKTNFRASLDWIVKAQNMTKILNGNYENRKEESSWKV